MDGWMASIRKKERRSNDLFLLKKMEEVNRVHF